MTHTLRFRRFAYGLLLAAPLALTACQASGDEANLPEATVRAAQPLETAETVAAGKDYFDESCASCHGAAAVGTDLGPPLVHRFYEPSHHADPAFVLAARNGVRAHHWRFGDMPPQPEITTEQITEITRYVRWLQRNAGIY